MVIILALYFTFLVFYLLFNLVLSRRLDSMRFGGDNIRLVTWIYDLVIAIIFIFSMIALVRALP